MEHYSILMSVYYKEEPEHLAACIQSMMDQTVLTDDFVIVCDGPLNSALDSVLDTYDQRYPGVFQIIRLPQNVGIGAAANAGLQYCRNELVAKMDADDLSLPGRCEKQLRLFEENPELTVVGGYIAEFSDDPGTPFAIRKVPAQNEEIRKFARRRQPFNNVTVMYRKSAVAAVGGYRALNRCEDFDLYTRLLHGGYQGQNIEEVLVNVRVDNGGTSRRGSLATLRGTMISRGYALKIGFSSVWDYLYCVLGELLIILSPDALRRFLYNTFLRQRC